MTFHLTIYQDDRRRERWWSGTPEDLDKYLDELGAPFVIVRPGGKS